MKIFIVNHNGVKSTVEVQTWSDIDVALNIAIGKAAQFHDSAVAVTQVGRVFVLSREKYGDTLGNDDEYIVVEPNDMQQLKTRYPRAVFHKKLLIDFGRPTLKCREYGYGFGELEVKRVVDRIL